MLDVTAHTPNTPTTQLLSPPPRPLRVVIPGGAGHLGRIVAGHLHAEGNAITVLARTTAVAPWRVAWWSGANLGDWTRELEGADVADSWRFSIEVAAGWEKSLFAANTPCTRKIALRSAMVMSAKRGGTFDLLLRLVRFGLGGACSSGKQFVSWIHEDDFVRALDYLITHEEFEGAINVASPDPLPNQDFMRILRKAWGTRVGLPASKWMLEIGAFFLRSET